jgi:hypothetical protein
MQLFLTPAWLQQEFAKSMYHWRRIPPPQVNSWNDRLLSAEAAPHQFPYWNEPYRRVGFSTVYLECTFEERPCAFAAMLCVGVPGFRIGLVDQGPINLTGGRIVEIDALRSLKKWAKRHGFAFLRFTHLDADVMDRVASVEGAKCVNAFPLYGYKDAGLFVELKEDEDEQLASFQRVARRNIRDARPVGYDIRETDSAEDFAALWPLFQSLSKRKGIQFRRPMEGWMEVIRLASEHDCVRLYTAHLAGKAVEAVAIVRGGRCAEYFLGAFDPDAAGDNPSPSCLLHWHAMRQAVAWGCKEYDLGPRTTEAIYQFKQKFKPKERLTPPPVTLVTNRIAYTLWSGLILRILLPLWPAFRSLLSRFMRRR